VVEMNRFWNGNGNGRGKDQIVGLCEEEHIK
jgi:hypothetical protein